MMKKTRILAIEISLLLIFSMSNLSLIIWNNIFLYYFLAILGGFLVGTITINIEKTLIVITIAFLLAFIISIVTSILPSYILGSLEDVNILITLITSMLSKHLVISFPTCTFVGILGCFFGRTVKKETSY